jgi:penicillin-binding protein 1A
MTGTAGDLALGTWGTTPLELTAAYAALANGGVPVVRYVVCEVKDNEGAVAYARAERPQGAPVIDPRHLRDMRRMLAAVVRGGTGRAADPGRGWAAGKTGTTADHRDAWFVGLTDRVAAGVWLGNASGAPTGGLTGGGPPARVWRAVVAEAGRGA